MLVGLRSETAACAGGVRSLVEAGLEWRDVTGCASLFRDAMGDETGNMDANIESTVVQRNVLSGTRSKAVDVGREEAVKGSRDAGVGRNPNYRTTRTQGFGGHDHPSRLGLLHPSVWSARTTEFHLAGHWFPARPIVSWSA
jgi:hypothetical protein